MLHTTLNQLKLAGACGQKVGSGDGYDKVRQALGKGWSKDTPIPLMRILDSNGLEDALWCLRAVLSEEAAERDRLARLFACDCAERVLPLWIKLFPTDKRPQHAIEVARKFAAGDATAAEREIVTASALAAERAAGNAWVHTAATIGAYRAASTAAAAARSVAISAAARAFGVDAAEHARLAAGDAAWASQATPGAAKAVAEVALAIERAWQERRLRELLEGHTEEEAISSEWPKLPAKSL